MCRYRICWILSHFEIVKMLNLSVGKAIKREFYRTFMPCSNPHKILLHSILLEVSREESSEMKEGCKFFLYFLHNEEVAQPSILLQLDIISAHMGRYNNITSSVSNANIQLCCCWWYLQRSVGKYLKNIPNSPNSNFWPKLANLTKN